ncbi:MAG TPA: OmpW family outer membrane protein [Methylocella sp.]|jgi:outer membrane protein|nr:OmpW family outer membrane protein [Methylocella sp.]
MTGAIRIWAAAFIAALAITRADAADLTPTPEPLPPAPPIFFVHVGALGAFYSPPDAQSTGGGLLKVIPVPGVGTVTLNNVAIPPSYTLGLEAGYFLTPNIALAISAGVPPLMHIKATAFSATKLLGTDLVGSVRFGPLMGLIQYHFTQWGNFQPYIGAGAAYVVMFANTSDGFLQNFSVDPTWCAVAQAGFDYMLTDFGLPNWGVFADAKKLIYLNPNFQGEVLNTTIHIKTLGKIDPWIASTGITFKY